MRSFFKKHIEPFAIDFICSRTAFTKQRERIVPLVQGVVVEFGIGTGLNVPFYNPNNVTQVIGIEPSMHLLKKAYTYIKHSSISFKILTESAENTSIETSSVDSILVTYTFCSIPNISLALKEAKRILKPSGKIYFCEHGKSLNSKVAKWQDRLNPAWNYISSGCNINRNITLELQNANFNLLRQENYALEKTSEIFGYHHFGIAQND